MMKGLFGKRMTAGGEMPATMPTMQNIPTTAGGMFGDQMPAPQQAQRQGFWQGGDKFTGRDAIAAALAVIGDTFGGRGDGVAGLMQSRMAPAQQAAALAAEQRKRAAELADYEAKRVIDQRYQAQDGTKPGSFEWWSDPARTEQERAAFAQYNDARTPDEPRMIVLPDGRAVFGTMDEIRAMVGGGAAAPSRPARPVGGLTPITGGAGGNASGNFR